MLAGTFSENIGIFKKKAKQSDYHLIKAKRATGTKVKHHKKAVTSLKKAVFINI